MSGILILPLSKGMHAVVDIEDAELVRDHKWHARMSGRTAYASTNDWSSGGQKMLTLHRLIMGTKAGEVVDHVNCNGLDNRRINLRTASRSQNSGNRRPNKDRDTDLPKGVCKDKRPMSAKNPYRAAIQGRYLGSVATAKAAAEAYERAARDLWGEFARVDNPPVDLLGLLSSRELT